MLTTEAWEFPFAGTFIDGKEIQSGSIAEVILGKTEIRLGGCDWVFSLQKDISHSASYYLVNVQPEVLPDRLAVIYLKVCLRHGLR